MKIQAASASQYQAHMDLVCKTYPEGIARAHKLPLETARELAKKHTLDELPQGLHTKGNYFYVLLEGEQELGYLWLKDFSGTYLCLFDIYLFEPYRRQGYGSQAMAWIKDKARELNCPSVWLHVFGFNQAAINFYRKNGYGITEVNMRLDL
ncbi:GNAT family N-acetyltransferase [Thalassomonas viridans]|uniref:GNAT family N-acetyltransferase n=1 Tax=Thalassomonas viridans TaxID=137584 RepID=A0AAE9Z7R8_9GAMM|nr:GNAT family N-acetyltransferase [Thalassomonas viridans]WDE07564.1 GNAT family N-acetyltransferase [Thalassomonas viridans]